MTRAGSWDIKSMFWSSQEPPTCSNFPTLLGNRRVSVTGKMVVGRHLTNGVGKQQEPMAELSACTHRVTQRAGQPLTIA